VEEWMNGRLEEWKSGRMDAWMDNAFQQLFQPSNHPFFHPSILPTIHSSNLPSSLHLYHNKSLILVRTESVCYYFGVIFGIRHSFSSLNPDGA
jgi:hypothetical protein